MDLTSDQLLKQHEGALRLEADEDPTTLEIASGAVVRSYQLSPASLPQLEAAARSMEGFRPAGKTSEDFVQILASFMPPEEAQRFVQSESVATVIKTMRGLTARTTAAMTAAQGQEGANA